MASSGEQKYPKGYDIRTRIIKARLEGPDQVRDCYNNSAREYHEVRQEIGHSSRVSTCRKGSRASHQDSTHCKNCV